MIRLNVADGRPRPFLLALTWALFCSCSLTAWMFASDRPVLRLPEFPLFRFKLDLSYYNNNNNNNNNNFFF